VCVIVLGLPIIFVVENFYRLDYNNNHFECRRALDIIYSGTIAEAYKVVEFVRRRGVEIIFRESMFYENTGTRKSTIVD